MTPREAASELRGLAERIGRLPSYDHKNPHGFHEGKSALVAEVLSLADALTARPSPPRTRRAPPIRLRRPVTVVVTPHQP